MSSIPSPNLRISFPRKTAAAPITPPLRKRSVSTGFVSARIPSSSERDSFSEPCRERKKSVLKESLATTGFSFS